MKARRLRASIQRSKTERSPRNYWEAALAETRRDFDERLRDGLAAAVANVEDLRTRLDAALAESIRLRDGAQVAVAEAL
jgi:division protein CdvB (Snf7/Vps24/ESCRT-III family)